MADILQDVRSLNENDDADETEIKGLVKCLNPKNTTLTGKKLVSWSRYCNSISDFLHIPSRCAVADSCAVSLDRRMTFGETWESCLDKRSATCPDVKKYGDDVVVSMYEL